MAASPSPVPAVTIVRNIPASASRVFAAWTDARLLSRWLAAHDCRVREASADPRPGGAYRIAVVCPPADDVHLTTGVYQELVPHTRIVMTWHYDGPHGADDVPSLLTVELREHAPGATELTLTHARARDARARDLLAAGWPTCLDKLEALLAERLVRVDFRDQGAAGTDVTVTETETSVAARHAASTESAAAWPGAIEQPAVFVDPSEARP